MNVKKVNEEMMSPKGACWKVGELIESLKQLDPEMTVVAADLKGQYSFDIEIRDGKVCFDLFD